MVFTEDTTRNEVITRNIPTAGSILYRSLIGIFFGFMALILMAHPAMADTRSASSMLLLETSIKNEVSDKVVKTAIKAQNAAAIAEAKAAQEAEAAAKLKEEQEAAARAQAEAAAKAQEDRRNAVVSFASQFIGNPYVYGGVSLTHGADCSGFVMSVYSHFGISLPHSSDAMAGVGSRVSGGLANALPGDIIVYDGHVGIYLGSGRLLSAQNSRKGITINSASYKAIESIRRVL